MPHYANLAARLLRKRRLHAVEGFERDLRVRERSLATIERAMRVRARRGVAYRVGLGLGAAAAALLLGVGLQRMLEPEAPPAAGPRGVTVQAVPLGQGAVIVGANGEERLETDLVLELGDRIATGEGGGALLNLSTGTRLELGHASGLVVHNEGAVQRFALGGGELDAKVAPLQPGERFVIDTPDAQVEVRGTAFRLRALPVAGQCGNGSRTRLEVRHGVVEVRARGQSVRISQGERWPADCPFDVVGEVAPAVDGPREQGPAAGSESAGPSAPQAGSRVSPSQAGEAEGPAGSAEPKAMGSAAASLIKVQADLFAEGVQAQKQGNVAGALRAYQELLSRFPASALAENALAERMRLLAGTEPVLAEQEARRYLARFPRGFARSDAERIAGAR